MHFRKRRAALLVCCVFLLCLLLSSVFILQISGHVCCGEQCRICALIIKTVKSIFDARILTCIFTVMFMRHVIRPFGSKTLYVFPDAFFRTLISLKTRIND